MSADVNTIQIAREGRFDADHVLRVAIYNGSQGVKPENPKADRRPRLATADEIKSWARRHNEKMRIERTAKEARAAALARLPSRQG